MAGADRPGTISTGTASALAPPWAARVTVIALLVGTALAGLVWHATRLNQVDAWVMRWQEQARPHARGLAAVVAATLPAGIVLVTIVAGATVAWRAGRRDAVVLAISAVPATLLAEVVLKQLVHRQWNGDPDLIFPSGHVAVTAAAAMTAVLLVRVVPAAAPIRVVAAYAGGVAVLLVAAARLVETVHSVTDVVGGAITGLVVTLGSASAITAWFGRPHRRASSGGPVGSDAAPAGGAGQSRS